MQCDICIITFQGNECNRSQNTEGWISLEQPVPANKHRTLVSIKLQSSLEPA